MLFHYISGALLCEIKIPGLTRRVDGWTVHSWWRDKPTHPDYVDYGDEDYGDWKHLLCESLSREAAQRIVTALGGYLVDDSYIHSGRQLGDGGPFWVHRFDLDYPESAGGYDSLGAAIDACDWLSPGQWFRIYGASGYMVMEIKKETTNE